MSSAPGMCQAYPNYTSDAPEDVSTALHGSGEGSLCTKVHAARASPLYVLQRASALSASRARGPCVVLSPALSDAHAAAAGAESRVNVPRVRLTCSRARTESRPIEACGGKRAARAGTHQLLLRPRRWRAERRPLSPCERRERRRRLRAASERFAASLQQHAAEPVCQCAAARRRRAPI